MLRGLAILMVVLFHAFGGFNWSALLGDQWGLLCNALIGEMNYGVQLFFLLSGFLIGGILLRSRQKQNYYKNFYIKRFLRILPIYFAVLIVLKVWMPVSWRFTAAAVLLMANFSRLFGAPLSEYGSLWSLAVEEHFYLLWPSCVRHLSLPRMIRILLVIIVTEPILRVIAIHISANVDIRFKTYFVLDYIAYGALIATLVYTGRITVHNARRLGLGLLAFGAPLVAASIWLAGYHPGVTLIALRTLPWMWLCSGVLLLGILKDSSREPEPQAHRPRGILPFFGYISYGLYLINPFMNDKLGHVIDTFVLPAAQATLTVFVAKFVLCISAEVAVAYLSRRFFEQPLLDLKGRLTGSHPQIETVKVSAMATQPELAPIRE